MLKIAAFLFVISFSILQTFAQRSISVGYYDSEITSRNIGITASIRKGKKTYSYGIKYHINDALKSWTSLGRNLYANNFAQRFGILLGYERDLFRNKKVAVKASYNLQGTMSGDRNLIHGIDFGTGLYVEEVLERKTVYFVDNIVGFVLDAKVNDKIGFYAKFGGGLMNSWYPAKNSGTVLGFEGDLNWDFIRYSYSVGISYSLANKPKEKKKK